jgi:hypothetical protein
VKKIKERKKFTNVSAQVRAQIFISPPLLQDRPIMPLSDLERDDGAYCFKEEIHRQEDDRSLRRNHGEQRPIPAFVRSDFFQ